MACELGPLTEDTQRVPRGSGSGSSQEFPLLLLHILGVELRGPGFTEGRIGIEKQAPILLVFQI
jgi:hypothetical protein